MTKVDVENALTADHNHDKAIKDPSNKGVCKEAIFSSISGDVNIGV